MSGGDGKAPTRREALAWLVAAGAVGVGSAQAETPGSPPAAPASRPRHRFGMAIDLDRCTRCQACVVACATENNVPPLGREAAASSRPIFWMDMLWPQDRETTPALGRAPLPIPCMHCENPPCVRVCPVGATYQAEDGIVAQIWDRCIGCRACMVACPYDRRYYNWSEPTWPGGDPSAANPDVAVRPAGVVEVCTFCQHRLRARYERARLDEETVTDEDLQRLPACAETCPTEAITFGDLADPNSALAGLARSSRAFRLLEHLGTEPKVFYLRSKR